MREESFIVTYLTVRNCYLHFSDHWTKYLNELNASTSALRVDYHNGKHAYFSWNPQFINASDISTVYISATYAQKLGIHDGEKVKITFHGHVAPVSRVFMSPYSSDDFEILAMNQNVLQSGLLDQIQIIWPGQTFVTWVGKSMYAVLFVDSLEPKGAVGRLQLMTEIVVNTPNENPHARELSDSTPSEGKSDMNSGDEEEINEQSYVQKTTSVVSFIWDSVQGISSRFWGKEECDKENDRSDQNVATILSDSLRGLEPLVYRVHPFQFSNENEICYQFLQPYNAYVHRSNVLLPLLFGKNNLIIKLTPVLFATKTNLQGNEEEKNGNEKGKGDPMAILQFAGSVFVRLCIIDDIVNNLRDEMKSEISRVFENHEQKCIYLTSTVRSALHMKIGSRVRMELENEDSNQMLVTVELTPNGKNIAPKDLEISWRKYLLTLCGESNVLINSDCVIPILTSHTIQHVNIKIVDPPVPYYLFTRESIEKCKVKIVSKKNKDIDIPVPEDDNTCYKDDRLCFSHIEKQIALGATSLEISLGLTCAPWPVKNSVISVANILIRGKAGSGTSSLARHLCGIFHEAPYYVYCVEIHCKSLKGKKVETLHKILSQALVDCSLHQPAILVLQDLDILAADSGHDQDTAQENRYYARVGEMIVELLEEYQPIFNIAVVATMNSSSKLNSTIMAARGQHTFLTVLDIPDLTKEDRLKILEKLVEKKISLGKSSLDINLYAQRSDGYVVQDLVDFTEKAVFEAWKRKALAGDFSKKGPMLQNDDLEKAFLLTQPLSLRGVELVEDAGLMWADIGGLEHAKKLLVEMLEWPVQFPELFAKAPLRLQSGVLLYGAPGTGKTLLAGAVAKECGLNFISVKGPELLSKYIGASEESVRNIFQKAQSAKPCVLFFDEFDSLAPRRGHDSTGVTDRVVNQLLTQLDGVESLNSVWVLAATSRPDLLDPALLRPGRLDRAILCPLPTQEDRLAILQSLSRKMTLAEDVDLEPLAKGSEGFTGADLQAVLYSAQLSAVEEISPLENTVEGNASSKDLSTAESSVSCNKGPIHVTQAHLLAALKETRPSLSYKEKQKYDAIYRNFEKSRSSSKEVRKKAVVPLIQKVTLA